MVPLILQVLAILLIKKVSKLLVKRKNITLHKKLNTKGSFVYRYYHVKITICDIFVNLTCINRTPVNSEDKYWSQDLDWLHCNLLEFADMSFTDCWGMWIAKWIRLLTSNLNHTTYNLCSHLNITYLQMYKWPRLWPVSSFEYVDVIPDRDLRKAHKCGGIKLVYGIQTLPLTEEIIMLIYIISSYLIFYLNFSIYQKNIHA